MPLEAKAICPKSIEQVFPHMDSCGKTVDVSQGSPQDCNPGQEGRIISPLEEQNYLHYVKMIAINDGFLPSQLLVRAANAYDRRDGR
jgi:hypothetical protein